MRTSNGLPITDFEKLSHVDFNKIIQNLEIKFNNQFLKKYASLNNDSLILNIEGWFICDYIVEQIMIIVEEINDDIKKI